MSKYIGSTLVAGVGRNTVRNAHTLLDFKWSDHIINSMEWLRADTFSWQPGSVYQAVHNHLVADITGKTAQSETVAGIEIWYYLSDDGHKIVGTSQEQAVIDIYNTTGVAWYYILDEANTRFKLPRTQFGFTGLRDGVGNYVEAGLPNITTIFDGIHWSGPYNTNSIPLTSDNGVMYNAGNSVGYDHLRKAEGQNWIGKKIGFDASKASSIYGNSTTVQPPATQMYLYFYVGQFSQSAIEQTAGLNAELFNGKADLSLVNTKTAHVVVEFQEPTASNNYTWYRKYADGWVEQGGHSIQGTNPRIITLPIEMADTHYCVSYGNDNSWLTSLTYSRVAITYSKTTTSLSVTGIFANTSAVDYEFDWQVSGMAAE